MNESDDYGECGACGNKSVGWRFVASAKGIDSAECPRCKQRTFVFKPMPPEIREDVLRLSLGLASLQILQKMVADEVKSMTDPISQAIKSRVSNPFEKSIVKPSGLRVNDPAAIERYGLGKGRDDSGDDRPRGWSTKTVAQTWRKWKDELASQIASAEFGAPEVTRDGAKVNREAWTPDGWHVGLEESKSSADGQTIFRCLAEHEGKNVRVRVPVVVVDEIRKRICPEAPGRSE